MASVHTDDTTLDGAPTSPTHAPHTSWSTVRERALYAPAHRIDHTVETALHRARHPRALKTVEMFSHLGDGGAVWLVILSTLARRDSKAALRAAVILALGTVIINGPVKHLTRRARPEPLDPEAFRPGGSSFPSGHSFSSWLVTAMLPAGSALKVPAAAIASGITTSRVFLRYHHATDVIAGAVLGASLGVALRRLVRWR